MQVSIIQKNHAHIKQERANKYYLHNTAFFYAIIMKHSE